MVSSGQMGFGERVALGWGFRGVAQLCEKGRKCVRIAPESCQGKEAGIRVHGSRNQVCRVKLGVKGPDQNELSRGTQRHGEISGQG